MMTIDIYIAYDSRRFALDLDCIYWIDERMAYQLSLNE